MSKSKLSGAIGIVESAPRFGDTVHLTWQSNDPLPWAHLIVTQGGELVEAGYTRLDTIPQFTLGPTPMWPSGAAEARVELVPFLTRTGNFGPAYASVVFEVAA